MARLVAANRLAYYALPRDRRPEPAPFVPLCDLYDLGPGAPAAARALSPRALVRWLDVERDLPLLRLMWGENSRGGQLKSRRDLLDVLASELARRDPASAPAPTPVP